MAPNKTSTRKGKQLKALNRPSASDLSEATARLGLIDNMAPGRRAPVICDLFDDDERNVTHIKKMTGSAVSQAKANNSKDDDTGM